MNEFLNDDVLKSVSGGEGQDTVTPFNPYDVFESPDGHSRFQIFRAEVCDPPYYYLYFGQQYGLDLDGIWIRLDGESSFYHPALRWWKKV